MCCLFNRWIKLCVWLCGRQFDETRLRTTVTDTFSSSWIDLKRHSVSSVMSDRRIIIWIYHVDSSFDHKVTSSIVIILKIEVSPIDSHWKIQFSNPEKGPKSEENDRYQKTGYVRGCDIYLLSQTAVNTCVRNCSNQCSDRVAVSIASSRKCEIEFILKTSQSVPTPSEVLLHGLRDTRSHLLFCITNLSSQCWLSLVAGLVYILVTRSGWRT